MSDKKILDIINSVNKIIKLKDPTYVTLEKWKRPNGLKISQIRVPIGVIGIIYESRPNVTADASALSLKSGNTIILRGGSESFYSSNAIVKSIRKGLKKTAVPVECVQMINTIDRKAVDVLLSMNNYIVGISINAKMRRTGICGATETLLCHKDVKQTILPEVIDSLSSAGCEIRGDKEVKKLSKVIISANERDWTTEYLDSIISVKIVSNVNEAITHIEKYGSNHTDSIITENNKTAELFLEKVNSAIVLHNASPQYADGGEFGMGAEMGIATGKLHARGPVGLEQLTTYKYQIRGKGQVRP